MITVNLSDLGCPEETLRARAVGRIAEAGRDASAFCVAEHGIPRERLQEVFAMTRRLFARPLEEKLRERPREGALQGYYPLRDGPGDVREKFLLTSSGQDAADGLPMLRGGNRWPAGIDGFRDLIEGFMGEFEALGVALMGGLSESLGLAPGALAPAFCPPGGSSLWLLHYPPVALVSGARGQGTSAHTDLHPMALIAQDDQDGLEVHSEAGWELAPTGSIVCQLGDVAARWSNDLVRANVHRVLSPVARSRYSLALFMQPAPDALIAPWPGCVRPDRPARYSPLTFAECFARWLQRLSEGTAGYVPGL